MVITRMTLPDSDLPIITSSGQYWEMVRKNTDHQLLDLAAQRPVLKQDIRYATSHNLLGRPLYTSARAFVRRPVAEALSQAQRVLARRGLGLCVYDAYRPYSATVQLFEHVADKSLVASPAQGSRHNRGCSVDVGLVELATGRPVPMPTEFDEFSPATHAHYSRLPTHIILNRCLLLAVMHRHGFVNYPGEWWHFDFYQWQQFELLDLPFEALEARQ